jgi:thiamine pyrophosphate-dependent acetolactate synthase large subunit-like protein
MSNNVIDRLDFIRDLLEDAGDMIIVTGIGTPSSNTRAVADRGLNFYMSGAMGCAASVGLGMALARPDRTVTVITGDAELMMNVGSLASIAVARPRNLAIVVVDNERFGATGSQISHTAHGVDIAGIAKASGFPVAETVREQAAVTKVRERIHANEGPYLCVAKVGANRRVAPGGGSRIRDGVMTRFDFMRALEASDAAGT